MPAHKGLSASIVCDEVTLEEYNKTVDSSTPKTSKVSCWIVSAVDQVRSCNPTDVKIEGIKFEMEISIRPTV
jgi:hypothetical protein